MRSSLRARNSPPNNAQHNHANTNNSSSSSSLSSARPERSTRSHHKSSPRRKSATPASMSDDDVTMNGNAATDHLPLTRRSTRQTVDDDTGRDDEELDGEAGESEDDITRCVCGHQDYPGPPQSDDLSLPPDGTADDAGGLFIQCDKCHVWQHGGCVGIMDESKSPENYFCELCDKRLHSVTADSRGQRYSKYLPLYPNEPKSARKGSLGKESDAKAKKERENISRASVDSIAKRRSTMNSRQAYDEEETLRRVIEESKGEDDRLLPLSGSRKGKRSRDDSEDSTKHEIKRQRTSSDSPDPPSTLHTASHLAESDDESSATRPTASSLKKARSVAAESQRQRDLTEREKTREMQRAEAAGRRKERAGRRRGDESEALDDTPRPEPSVHNRTSQPPSPPASATPQAPSSSHKRGGNKKAQKRGGRNQYTKDRDFSAKPVASPHRPRSHPQPQTSSGEEPVNSKNSPNPSSDLHGPAKARLAKAKAKNARQQPAEAEPNKEREKDTMSLGDMKKRAAMMVEYISKAQIELSADRPHVSRIADATDAGEVRPSDAVVNHDDFKDMTSRDMMNTLTSQIAHWQKQYADTAPTVN